MLTKSNASLALSDEAVTTEFPIQSQTSIADKRSLLVLRDAFSATDGYRYIEIGSYLGGSLCPFLNDVNCHEVLSIDQRGRNQPDERGRTFDYTAVGEETMLEALHAVGIPSNRLRTFDGSVSDFAPKQPEFDLAFIDGEHTDWACFRDFIHVLPMMKADSVVAFHDSSLTPKALRIINEYLAAAGEKFQFCKILHSEVSVVFRGGWSAVTVADLFDTEIDLDLFYRRADEQLLRLNCENRVPSSVLLRVLFRRLLALPPLRQVNQLRRSLFK